MSEPTLFDHLAEFAYGIVDRGHIPEAVIVEAKYALLDTIGCMIAGSVRPEGRAFAAAEASVSVPQPNIPGVQPIGFDTSLPEAGAARVNGYIGDILELNDLIGGHASIGAVSTMLTLAQTLRLDGHKALGALITGIEVTARVNMGYRESNGGRDNRAFTDVGISSEGIPSTIGTSALTAVALGLDEDKIAAAMAIGGSLAGWCPAEVLFGDGGSIKPILFGGWPATVGLMAGRYASAGLTGPRKLLECPIGLYATVAKGYDPAIVQGVRGWQLAHPRRKWHACCGFIHAGIDGVIRLRIRHGPAVFDNVTIEIGVVPPVAPVIAAAGKPNNPTQARFNGPFNIAIAALEADRIQPHHADDATDILDNPSIENLLRRVRFVPAPELPHFSHSHIRLREADGTIRVEEHVSGYKGSAANPLTHRELEEKFLALTAGLLRNATDYMANILTLERHTDLSFLQRDSIPLHKST
ncbi:MmgE/PrpD family protein [Acetobacter persici]|uniref:MmgE/PrpD family protein n=1 Tax=Acetobacter persici TaxID=1076596 RepID=UPI0036DD045E